MTEEIEAALAHHHNPARTREGVPWAYVTRVRGGTAVYVWREAERCMGVEALRALFGLTPTQARTAQLLFGRRTNQEIGAILGVAVNTVRRHVEAVLYKLDAPSRFHVEEILSHAAIENLRVTHEGE